MTNGIKASDFSDMASNVSFDLPFQNPKFYHSYQYTPLHQYTPPYTPYTPPPPPYPPPPPPYTPPIYIESQFVVGTPFSPYLDNTLLYQHLPISSNTYAPQLFDIIPERVPVLSNQFQPGQQPEMYAPQVFDDSPHSPELISNSSNDNYHQMDDKFTKIIQKLEEIGKSLADRSRIFKELSSKKVNDSEGSPEVCEDSTQNQNSTEVIVDEQCEDKRNQIIQILEKMEKRLADLSNPVKEMPSNKVNRSITTPTPVLIDDSLDDLCRIENIVYDDIEDLNQLKVSRIGMFAPHMFDESPENIYMAQIPPTPLYPHKSEVLNVKSSERSFTAGLGNELTKNHKETVYKLHEDERGKFEPLAASSKHTCESELLEKGIGFDLTLKCFCGYSSWYQTMCFDSVPGQFDQVPQKGFANWKMLEELLNWFCYKSQNDVSRVDCLTTHTPVVAYIRYLALLKGREIRSCSPKYDLLVKLTIANALTYFYLKHEIEMSVVGLFEIMPLGEVVIWIVSPISSGAFRLVYHVVRHFNWMAERKPVIFKPLLTEFRQYGRGSRHLKIFSTMLRNVTNFSRTIIVNACELLPETPISKTIQEFEIKVVLKSEECSESALSKLYPGSGQLEYATFYKKLLLGVGILWESCWGMIQKFIVFILEDKNNLKNGQLLIVAGALANGIVVNKYQMFKVKSVKSNDRITMTEGVNLDAAAGFYARFLSNIDPRMQWRPGIYFLNQKDARHFLRKTEITVNTSILGSYVLCDSESSAYQSNRDQLLQTAEKVFSNASEEYSQLWVVKEKFERWKRDYPSSYNDAYMPLSIPAIFSPHVSVQEDDADANTLPELVEKVAVSILHHQISYCWDMLSTSETEYAVTATSLVFRYVPLSSKALGELVAALRDRLSDAVSELTVPTWNTLVMKAVPNSARVAAYKFGVSVHLMRNICLWNKVLSMTVLEKLTLDDLLSGTILPHLRSIQSNVHDAVTRTERIIALLCGVWSGSGVTGERSLKLQPLVDYLLVLGKILEKKHNSGGMEMGTCRNLEGWENMTEGFFFLILEDKDVLKERNMSRFELVDNVGPDFYYYWA